MLLKQTRKLRSSFLVPNRPIIRKAFASLKYNRNISVAIVGSGPAGYYCLDELLKLNLKHFQAHLFEKKPYPFGLVRSGVAPDHPEVKVVENHFTSMTKRDDVEFFGNVEIGKDISVEELRKMYHIVIFAYGAENDRRLGIPGEDLDGVHSARDFVEWYNSSIGRNSIKFDLSSDSAVIIGNGNVAVDVARILARDLKDLETTDISSNALEKLSTSKIRDINLVGRRGPVQAAFTTKELREIINMDNVSCQIVNNLLITTDVDSEELKTRAKKRMFELLRSINKSGPKASKKNIQFHFFNSPVEFIEDPGRKGKLGAVKFEFTFMKGEPFNQYAVGTGEYVTINAGIAFKSIGYISKPIQGLPFDERKGTVLNEDGRVPGFPGTYVCGWAKRGPSGIIGTNKWDAEELIVRVNEDLKNGLFEPSVKKHVSKESIVDILNSRKVPCILFEDWENLDRMEVEQGKKRNKVREKFSTIDEVLDALNKNKQKP